MSDIISSNNADNVTNNMDINTTDKATSNTIINTDDSTTDNAANNENNPSGNSKLRDSSAKIIFADPILCSQFLSGYLDIPLLKNVQPEDIEDVTNRYVHLFTEERNSDVVKKVHIAENAGSLPFYIISIIEHKSQIDYNVVMQVLRYIVFIWEDYEKEMEKLYPKISKTKDFKYPPILPIVFYDDVQNWTADMQLHDRIFLSDVLGEFIPNYRYILMKSDEYSNAELMEHKDELSVLMMLLNLHKSSDFNKIKNEVNPEYFEEVFKSTPEYLLNLVAQIVEVLLKKYNVPEKEIDEFSGQIKERNMGRLFAHVEAFDVQAVRREARAEGISEGKSIGITEGKTAGFIDAVHQLGGTMETAVQQLMILYGLNEEEAQEKVRLYW